MLALLSGVLLYLGWPPLNMPWLLFFAWLPLLRVIDLRIERHKSPMLYIYITLITWNALTTWWIWYSTGPGAVAAVVVNPLFQIVALNGYVWVRRLYKNIWSYAALIVFWLCFEYIHLHWELAWPWLTLGNGLATVPQLVQWYSITGRLGGTIWIWLINLYIYEVYRLAIEKKLQKPVAAYGGLIALIAIPCIASIWMQSKPDTNAQTKYVSCVAVQPNVDPYNGKFDPSTLQQQVTNLIQLTGQAIDSNTQLVFWPETSLPQPVLLNEANDNTAIQRVRAFIKQHPRITLITGAEAYRMYDTKETETCKLEQDGKYYDSYNAALMIDTSLHIQEYYKSRFVPGVESVPYYAVFKFLEPVLTKFGGMSGSYGHQKEASVLTTRNGLPVGSVICYESVFGDYCRGYVNKGAQILGIVTNDGWWMNTDGHKQHALYASLLAIELHRCIVRAANTGTSCFVDAQGHITQATEWWQPTAIKSYMPLYTDITPFARWGDILGELCIYLTIAIIIFVSYKKFTFKYNAKP